MCGILIHNGKGDNTFIRHRGPDYTSTELINRFHFTHNLLHITGEFTPQPFIDGDIVAVFNGEIYNQPFTKSDGECIIPLYKEYGYEFPNYLDGEFAIALYDFRKYKALFITDPFGTKPLYHVGPYCASYHSGLIGIGDATAIPPNTLMEVDLLNGDIKTFLHPLWKFDFNNQTVNHYENWLHNFEMAVWKRARNGCFIGLSSGYDSGAIACELLKQQYDFKAYSILAQEMQDVIYARAQFVPTDIIEKFNKEINITHLEQNGDYFFYNINYDNGLYVGSYKEDPASIGLSEICRRGKLEGRKVYLSGQGADEILSDYSLIPNQSYFKGNWPDSIAGPWPNFYGNCQMSYIGKEERVAGSWGIETRYPFLDKALVQDFLNLKPELKNRAYKAPLHDYLQQNDFPFAVNTKIGFTP